MKERFDNLISEGRDIDAVRYLAQEYYDNGKMGYTRKLLLERVADKCEEYEQIANKCTKQEIRPLTFGELLQMIAMLRYRGAGEDTIVLNTVEWEKPWEA